jgi:large subunit ribosomal protein L23
MIQVEKILLGHVITEKATAATSNLNQYTFKVADDANQTAVKHAIEVQFGVKVAAVQIINVKSRTKRDRTRRGRYGIKSGYKKAIVRLKTGDSISLA